MYEQASLQGLYLCSSAAQTYMPRTSLHLPANPLSPLDWLLFEDRWVFAGVLVRLLQKNRTHRIIIYR